MSDPATQPLHVGWTQVPNLLVDRFLPLLKPTEWAVLTILWREAYGWAENRADGHRAILSSRMIAAKAGLGQPTAKAALDTLCDCGIIAREHRNDVTGHSLASSYQLKVDAEGAEIEAMLAYLGSTLGRAGRTLKTRGRHVAKEKEGEDGAALPTIPDPPLLETYPPTPVAPPGFDPPGQTLTSAPGQSLTHPPGQSLTTMSKETEAKETEKESSSSIHESCPAASPAGDLHAAAAASLQGEEPEGPESMPADEPPVARLIAEGFAAMDARRIVHYRKEVPIGPDGCLDEKHSRYVATDPLPLTDVEGWIAEATRRVARGKLKTTYHGFLRAMLEGRQPVPKPRPSMRRPALQVAPSRALPPLPEEAQGLDDDALLQATMSRFGRELAAEGARTPGKRTAEQLAAKRQAEAELLARRQLRQGGAS